METNLQLKLMLQIRDKVYYNQMWDTTDVQMHSWQGQ